jgi:hypothetical protein
MAKYPFTYLVAISGLAATFAFGDVQEALAFTETAVPPVQRDQKNLKAPQTNNALSLTPEKSDTDKLKIKGLETVIPKLDFGMELLYGGEGHSVDQGPSGNSDDVQIKGTITHRF